MASNSSEKVSPANYVLTRDYIDNNRINLQHYLWIELFGYHIHPDFPVTNPNLKIADIGTGTAIWLTDLSRRLPSTVSLDGLDVSFDAAPPPQSLPTNLTLRHWDVKQSVPDDLMEKYDIINIRNFTFVLQEGEVSDVLRRLIEMLKPGGCLQWAETDLSSYRIEKANPENEITALVELEKLTMKQDPRLQPRWAPKLPIHFSSAGLEDVKSDVRDSPAHLALAKHECNLVIHELFARKSQNTALIQELQLLMPRVLEETRKGSWYAFTRWTVIGRKPT